MNRQTAKSFVMLSQIGVNMFMTILICFFIGKALDIKLNSSPWFIIIFLILGACAGIRNMIVLAKKF